MIGRLLSAGVNPFQLSFGHVARANHIVVAPHIRRQRACGGKPDGGIGPSAFCNIYHSAACVMALVVPRRYGSLCGRYCDIALIVSTLPYFASLILLDTAAVVSNREACDSRKDSEPQLATSHKNRCDSWAREPESGHDWSPAGIGRRCISPQFQPWGTS